MASQSGTKRKSLVTVDTAYEQYKRDLPRYRMVKEIMSRNVFTTTPETSLEEAAHIMGEKHIGSLIVMKYKTPVGIIIERDLLSKALTLGLMLSDEKVENLMSYPLAGVSAAATIKEAAQLMTEKKSRLAVYDGWTLTGIVTASDLIKSLPSVPETETKVEEFMVDKIITADEETSVINIARLMGAQRVGSVIITKKGEPFGIFTERDLLSAFLAQDKVLFTHVGPNCSSPLIATPIGTSVHSAVAIMAMKHIRRLPIVRDDKIVGIITTRDLAEAYAQ